MVIGTQTGRWWVGCYICSRWHKISHYLSVKHVNCHVQRENSVTCWILDFHKVV